VAASENDGLVGPRQATGHTTTESAPDSHAILDDYGERLDLIGKIPEQASVTARDV
jgi:hypothetical protein